MIQIKCHKKAADVEKWEKGTTFWLQSEGWKVQNEHIKARTSWQGLTHLWYQRVCPEA